MWRTYENLLISMQIHANDVLFHIFFKVRLLFTYVIVLFVFSIVVPWSFPLSIDTKFQVECILPVKITTALFPLTSHKDLEAKNSNGNYCVLEHLSHSWTSNSRLLYLIMYTAWPHFKKGRNIFCGPQVLQRKHIIQHIPSEWFNYCVSTHTHTNWVFTKCATRLCQRGMKLSLEWLTVEVF